MKRSKLCLILVIAFILSLSVTGCVKSENCNYSDWTLTTAPTLTETGIAKRVCQDCKDVQEVIVPALNDNTVWTLETTNPTHVETGKNVYSSIFGTVEEILDIIPHTHSVWVIINNPTLTDGGEAIRICSCGDTITQQLPALTDAMWTVDHQAPATHFADGLDVYTSEYGKVNVVLPMIAHTYGEWTITEEPTLTAGGKAQHGCECEHVETVEIPALTDAIWTCETLDSATHTKEGVDKYTSVYGAVEVVTEKLTDHVYGDSEWTITEEPTLTAKGVAERTCICSHVDRVEIAELQNAEVWANEVVSKANYNQAGLNKYTSVYGTVEVVTEKLVAPYDNMTYLPIALDSDDYVNGVVNAENVWSRAFSLDANGKGFGYMHMFRAYNEFAMADASTGAITIKASDVIETDGVYSIDPEGEINTYVGYVDFASGMVVVKASSSATYGFVFVLIPNQTDSTTVEMVASAWDNAMAIDVTANGNTQSTFIYNEKVYFGVSFVDMAGNAVAANACHNNGYVYVMQNGKKLAGFAYNGEKLVVTDGYEGTYANDSDSLTLSGFGIATLNGESATYQVVDGVIALYTANTYYEVTFSNETFTMVKPMVTVSFNAGDKATIDAVEINKNVVYDLPVPEHDMYTFKGWYYDAAYSMPVESEFKPTESVTLYAQWKEKVLVNLVGVIGDDANELRLGEGDVIGQYLPVYGVEESVMKKFMGWYLDAEFSISLPEEAEVTANDTGITIYAKWEDLPAYYGTYYGGELWNAGYGNSGGKTLVIDENGNMSGLKTGIIESYDPATQMVTWKQSASSTTTYKFYFDATTGVIAGIYNNNEIGNDFHFLSRYEDSAGKVNAHYGIYTVKTPGSSSRGWYAHFINAETKLGTIEIFLYNNYIYSEFTATDAYGAPVTAANVKDMGSVIVKDANGNILVAVAAGKGTFAGGTSTTIDLDAYFGTYVNGSDTVILDGAGGLDYNGVRGTYEKVAESLAYGFDVYLNDGAEYWQLTLNGESFTMVKPMVTVYFDAGEYANVENLETNANIVITLPVPTHETNVFNGWYFDSTFATPVGETFVPTENITLYALWKVKVTLTVNANNGSEATVITYSQGDEAIVVNPENSGYALAGWYTTSDFAEGSEWAGDKDVTAGQVSAVITESVVIYAKWVEAPVYTGKYVSIEFDTTNANGGATAGYARNAAINIDPYGKGPKGSSWPFASGDVVIKNYNAETGYIEFHIGSSNAYYGYFDVATRFVVLSQTNKSTDLQEVMVLNPYDEKNTVSSDNPTFNTSYWASGDIRTITYNATGYNIFIMNDVVYFGVTFTDANGEAVVGNACYQTAILYVKDANGELIAKFGYDGTTMQTLDGNEGTYANGSDTLVIDGVKVATLNGVEGTYTKAADGSAYGFDVYVGGCYYEVTLDKDAGTYAIVKPMVTVSFETDGKAVVESITVNKNIEITLSIPENDEYIFRNWYKDAEYANVVSNNYVPTESLTLYAKWDIKVTLTVVYGNGLETVVYNYGSGDLTALEDPAFTNEKAFAGWYLDKGLTIKYTVGTAITENTTIYGAWMGAVAMMGEYYGWNLWQDTAKNISAQTSIMQTITADGIASGKKSGSVSDYDPTTGAFMIDGKYYAVYDGGAMAFAYGTNATSLAKDLYFMVNKPIKDGSNSITLTSSSYTKLITINFQDGTTENYLLMADRIYSGVTWVATNSSDEVTEYTPYNVGNAATLTVYARDGVTVLFSK